MCSPNKMRSRYCIRQDCTFPEFGRRTRGDPSFSSIHHRFRPEPETTKPSSGNREESVEAMIEKQSNGGGKQRHRSLKRAIMIETWMEKQSSGQSSTSSESSSGGVCTLFSSSETESCYRDKLCSSGFNAPRPKQLRSDNQDRGTHKSSDGFAKTKLRASETYGELKKPKQPISPGRRISIFLHSIFSSSNGRKAKMCSIVAVEDVNLDCRSKTQPLSRSCTTTTGKKFKNGAHKTVRFYPVRIIVDEYSRSFGSEDDPSLMPAKPTGRNLSSKTVVTEEVEIEKQSINGGSPRDISKRCDQTMKGESEADEEDANSCASSELFELDHLIGKVERFKEELPVYETTSL